MASKSVERLEQRHKEYRRADHATGKCVGIVGIAYKLTRRCAARDAAVAQQVRRVHSRFSVDIFSGRPPTAALLHLGLQPYNVC